MPIVNPSMVASTMPIAATRRVLRRPTQKARPKVEACGVVIDQCLADVEPGSGFPEIEAGCHLCTCKIFHGIVDRTIGQKPDGKTKRRL